ncbi:hypothetical protein L7F22_011622 [Adiantum nelumboides]|nr:hypothetical protein [Adiantum nelumboides]
MADRPDDVTEEVSSSQGQQTHEVGESLRPPQTDDDIFRTQLITAVTMFTQVMQNPRFLAFLQPPLPSQQVGSLDHVQKPVKAQAHVIHTTESMETPIHLTETMKSPIPVPNVQEQVAETPIVQAVPVQPATFQQPITVGHYELLIFNFKPEQAILVETEDEEDDDDKDKDDDEEDGEEDDDEGDGLPGTCPLASGDSYLVAGTDGVGTKLKLAFETQKHDTIGIDLVAMSVNDIVTSGAKPLFFLDYFATSQLDVDLAEQVIKGIVEGCKQSDCVLLGGETAEMPGFYGKGEYDLSGFAVGIVKKEHVVDGKGIQEGDVLLGLPSSGVHSNGFSLVRRILSDSGVSLSSLLPDSDSTISIGEALMAPTMIYVKQVLELVDAGKVKGLAHITGGGFTDNIPRIFPEGFAALVNVGSWEVPPIFKWLQRVGGVNDMEMMRTFNMGIGMVIVASPESAEDILASKGDKIIYKVGQVVKGDGIAYR